MSYKQLNKYFEQFGFDARLIKTKRGYSWVDTNNDIVFGAEDILLKDFSNISFEQYIELAKKYINKVPCF